MELKLLHIYPDVMNLYGEYANVAVLARFLRSAGHTVTVDTLSLFDTRDISGYDLYYMGAGTERKQKAALAELMRYRDALQEAFKSGKVMLFTGNAFELLGKSISVGEKTYPALGLADFTTEETDRRITGDVLAEADGFARPIVGFMNKCSHTTGVDAPLFRLTMGFGNENKCGAEGWHAGSCYGTHITGPILVKNPDLLRHFAHLLTGEDALTSEVLPCMERGYEITRAELEKRREATK